MCGILGFLATDSARSLPDLTAAVRSLGHRGPDDSGIWHEGAMALGFVRLAIIDLSPSGHQPMESPDKRYVIVFNGEIYNFPELRADLLENGESFQGHSDTEVLLRLYQRLGLDGCLAKLRGMFAFAIWDRTEQTLVLVRDRLGVKPLVYAETSDGLAFASEIGSLFALLPNLSREADPVAIDQYLSYQYVPSPRTGFAALRKLPPAHAMVVRRGRIERSFRYWDINNVPARKLGFAEAAEELRERVLEATRIRMVADVPLGAFLSGGVDSSITVAAMARCSDRRVNTFAIGFDEAELDELPYARRAAQHLGTSHHEEVCRPDAAGLLPELIGKLGEPFADNSILPSYHVARFARQDVTVALTGDGGDEAFAGYRRHRHLLRADRLEHWGMASAWTMMRKAGVAAENIFRDQSRQKRFPHTAADGMLAFAGAERYRHLVAHISESDKASLLSPEFRASLKEDSLFPLSMAWERGESRAGLNRWLYLDTMTYLPDDVLAKVDIASMAVSLECRSPLLDHTLVEFAASIPPEYKLGHDGRSKHLLKAAFSSWFPDGFLERPKMGFSAPTARWLRADLKEMLADSLEHPIIQHWTNPLAVTAMVERHQSGKQSHAKPLWALLCLAVWAERFKVVL